MNDTDAPSAHLRIVRFIFALVNSERNKMRIAVLANLKVNAPHLEGVSLDQWDDLDSRQTVDLILDALTSEGHEAEFFEASILPPYNLIDRLQAFVPDICFNIAEGHFGDSREAHIPSILEMLQIPYTGSRVMTLALALDKPMTKRILTYHDLPTPEFQVFEHADDLITDDLLGAGGRLRFPMIVKPSREGTGIGVTPDSIVNTVDDLRNQVSAQVEQYKQPILVERYINGREVTVGVIGNLPVAAARRLSERSLPNELPETLTFFPALEVNVGAYKETDAGLYTNRIKVEVFDDVELTCPADISPETERELQFLTAAVFRVTGCADVARVDFRLDETQGYKPYILEINPLPGLNPMSDLCIESRAAGWSHNQLINAIVRIAYERHKREKAVSQVS